MNSLRDACKILGYVVVTGSVIYSGSAILANSEVSQVALRILASSPFTGAKYGSLTFGCVGALIGYSGGDSAGKFYFTRGHMAFTGGIIGGVSGAITGAILLTAYNHISINIV